MISGMARRQVANRKRYAAAAALAGIVVASLSMLCFQAAAAVISIHPVGHAAGTDISNAFSGVTLSTAQAHVDDPAPPQLLALTSSTKGSVLSGGDRFRTADGSDIWSAGVCCGPDFALRVDFAAPVSSISVVLFADDLDTGLLQIYDGADVLIEQAALRTGGFFTLSLASATPIAYALTTFVDTGSIIRVDYVASAAHVAEPASAFALSGSLLLLAVTFRRRRGR